MAKKKLLRDFLLKHLDDGKMRCLRWLDREQSVFQIYWIHANSPQYRQEDGELFRQWAIYKDRYKPGADGQWPKDDYTNWKANFRCAVNRNREIEIIEGQDKDLKTYKLLPRGGKREDMAWEPSHWQGQGQVPDEGHGALKTSATISYPSNTDGYSIAAFANEQLTQYVPEVVASLTVSPPGSFDQGSNDSFHFTSITDINALLAQATNPDESIAQLTTLASMEAVACFPEPGSLDLPESLSLLSFKTSPHVQDMCIWLRYRDKVVGKYFTRSKDEGCRLVSSGGRKVDVEDKFIGRLLGAPAPEMTYTTLRDGNILDATKQILDALGNGGLHLYCDTVGNIYATRLTGCRIYHADPNSEHATLPVPLPRRTSVRVFNMELFEGRLKQWQEKKGPEPSVTILFSIGESWNLTKPINKCYITLTVVHAHSVYMKKMLKQRQGPEMISVDVDNEDMVSSATLERITIGL